MIAKVLVDKFSVSPYDKSAREAFEKFCTAHEIEIPEKKEDGYYEKDAEFIVDLSSMLHCGFKFLVEEFVTTPKAKGVLQDIKRAPDNITQNISINNDDFLYKVDEVEVLEDCCTDHLMEQLDDGWRILSICGAYKQRRPDYIVGRAKKDNPC